MLVFPPHIVMLYELEVLFHHNNFTAKRGTSQPFLGVNWRVLFYKGLFLQQPPLFPLVRKEVVLCNVFGMIDFEA